MRSFASGDVRAKTISRFLRRRWSSSASLIPCSSSPVMTTGSLGAYGEGWSPLFVFETTTKQVAAYKVQMQAVGTKSTSRFVLLEIRSYAALPALPDATN